MSDSNLDALRRWCKRLAVDPPAGKQTLRIALLLVGLNRPATGAEIRDLLGISPSSLTRARGVLAEHVQITGHTLSLSFAASDEVALMRVQAVLHRTGLADAARVWAPKWQRELPVRFSEVAGLSDKALAEGCQRLRQQIAAKAPQTLRWDYALDGLADHAASASVQLELPIADRAPKRPASRPPPVNGHAHSPELLRLVSAPPAAWTATHAAAVVAAADLPHHMAPALLEARERWAGKATEAEWARDAPKRTLAFLDEAAA